MGSSLGVDVTPSWDGSSVGCNDASMDGSNVGSHDAEIIVGGIYTVGKVVTSIVGSSLGAEVLSLVGSAVKCNDESLEG